MWYVTLLSILFILICPLMVLIVLMQDPKGGGLAGVLGGGGGGSAFGAKTADVVMKATIALGVLFFILSISMALLIKGRGGEAVTTLDAQQAPAAAPAMPGEGAAPLVIDEQAPAASEAAPEAGGEAAAREAAPAVE